jgi:hypothetical protein
MNQVSTRGSRWTMTAELDRQPEDATSSAGVAVCRLRLVKYPEGGGGKVERVVLYATGRLAERCRDGLGEGDVIEAVGWLPRPQRPRAEHPEILIPDTPGAVRLRCRASQIESAAGGTAREPRPRGRIVDCRQDDYDIYIGRGRDPRTGELGKWGNRYSDRPSKVPGVIMVRTVDEAIGYFRRDLFARIRAGKVSLTELAALDGKTLGCWHEDPADAWRAEHTGEGPAEGEPCHGHVLISAAAWAKKELGSDAR